jgi:hypothetical protein
MDTTLSDKEAFRRYCLSRMTDKKKFIQLFYELLYQSASEGKDVTHLQMFKALNQLYFNITGKLRFKDYLSFHFTKIRLEQIALRGILKPD